MLPKHYIRGLFAQGHCQQPEAKLCQGKKTLKKGFHWQCVSSQHKWCKISLQTKSIICKVNLPGLWHILGRKRQQLSLNIENIKVCSEKLQIIGQPLHFFSTSITMALMIKQVNHITLYGTATYSNTLKARMIVQSSLMKVTWFK